MAARDRRSVAAASRHGRQAPAARHRHQSQSRPRSHPLPRQRRRPVCLLELHQQRHGGLAIRNDRFSPIGPPIGPASKPADLQQFNSSATAVQQYRNRDSRLKSRASRPIPRFSHGQPILLHDSQVARRRPAMRLPIHAWKSTLTSLGFRRAKGRKARGRAARIETLEIRQLLSVSSTDVYYSPEDAGALLANKIADAGAREGFVLSPGETQLTLDTYGRVRLATEENPNPQPSEMPMPTTVVFFGENNADDTLNIDMGTLADSPIKTVIYHGGSAGYDTLKLFGGA